MDRFEQYLDSLAGSWRALVAPHAGATVVRTADFIGCRHPNVVFNNGVVLDPQAVEPAQGFFADAGPFALWCRDDDAATTSALTAAGLRRDVTTRPMRCELAAAVLPTTVAAVVVEVDPHRIAELNGLPGDVLAGVPSARGFATSDGTAGLVLIAVGTDVNVSFVATRPDARRRGLGTAVTAAALRDARAVAQRPPRSKRRRWLRACTSSSGSRPSPRSRSGCRRDRQSPTVSVPRRR